MEAGDLVTDQPSAALVMSVVRADWYEDAIPGFWEKSSEYSHWEHDFDLTYVKVDRQPFKESLDRLPSARERRRRLSSPGRGR